MKDLHMIAMIGISDQPCWLTEACDLLLLSTKCLGRVWICVEDLGIILPCAGPNRRSSAEATGQQLTKLLASHDSLSTWAVEGRNAKPKKSDTSTQVNTGPLARVSFHPMQQGQPRACGC